MSLQGPATIPAVGPSAMKGKLSERSVRELFEWLRDARQPHDLVEQPVGGVLVGQHRRLVRVRFDIRHSDQNVSPEVFHESSAVIRVPGSEQKFDGRPQHGLVDTEPDIQMRSIDLTDRDRHLQASAAETCAARRLRVG